MSTPTLPRWAHPEVYVPSRKRAKSGKAVHYVCPRPGEVRYEEVQKVRKFKRGKALDNYRRNITKAKRERIYRRDGKKCLFCGATEPLTLDHIVPVVLGGTNLDSNLQTLCAPCNNAKGQNL